MSIEKMPPVGERPTKPAPTATRPWWQRPFSVFQTNLQEIDALLDVDEVLDFIEGYGSDAWLINTGGISSLYPTDLPFQTRNPFLADRASGDLIGDAVAAAHNRNIRVIARLDLSKVAARIAQEHPEWLFVSPTGRPQIYNTLFSTCPSGDYYQHRSLDILDEIIDRYAVDGFFFNWFGFSERDYSRVYHGVCHCANCQEAFDLRSGGKPLPSGPTSETYRDWLVFADQTVTALTTKIGGHIAARRPDSGLILGRGAQVVYYEANNAFGRETWHHATAETVSAHVSAQPDVPLMVNAVSFIDMPYRMAGEQPERFAQYLVQAIARGGNPCTYIMGTPGRMPYANISIGRSITQFYRRHASLYAQLRPAATTALLRPAGSQVARPANPGSVEEFRGIYASLQEVHHPFDVVPVESVGRLVSNRTLPRYSCLIAPDLGALGSDTATALDTYVRSGGNLIMTGSSGLAEHGDVELGVSPALMQIGAPIADDALWSTYVTDRSQPRIGEYHYVAPVIPVYGDYRRFVWKPCVTKIGWVLPQAPFGPPEKCYGHTRSDDPGLVRIRCGTGEVTMVPWTIGRTYREFGTSEVRDLLLRVIEPLARPTVTADLPEQVELILGRQDNGFALHLINLSGAKRNSFGPHLPIRGGRIRLHNVSHVGAVDALVSGEQLHPRTHGDELLIDLPPVELFEVVRIAGVQTD